MMRSQLVQIELSQVGHRRGQFAERLAARASAIWRAASASDGPDVRRIRRAGSRRTSASVTAWNEASGQRRNGLPALTWITTSGVLGADAGRAQPRVGPGGGRRDRRPSRPRRRPGRAAAMPSGASRSHWLRTEWRGRRSGARATRLVYIQPRPLDVVADASRRAAGPGEPAAARPAVQVDGHVEARAPQPSAPGARRRASRASPRGLGATMTSLRWGLPVTIGAAAGSTR